MVKMQAPKLSGGGQHGHETPFENGHCQAPERQWCTCRSFFGPTSAKPAQCQSQLQASKTHLAHASGGSRKFEETASGKVSPATASCSKFHGGNGRKAWQSRSQCGAYWHLMIQTLEERSQEISGTKLFIKSWLLNSDMWQMVLPKQFPWDSLPGCLTRSWTFAKSLLWALL